MEITKFNPPSQVKGKTFLSKTAGKFSDVPQRTVQLWTEKGLIVSRTRGTGDRRGYTVLNCIEIALIKSLARDRVSFKIIGKIMRELRKSTPLTLERALGYERAFLIIRHYETGNIGVSCVSHERFGSRDGEIDGRSFNKFWQDTTIPKDTEHVRTYIVNLKYIERKTLKRMLEE